MQSKIQLIQGDCLEKMKEIPDKSIDLVLTDPPYNINIANWDRFEENEYLSWCGKWLDEITRVTRQNGSIYIFGDFRFIGDIKVLMNGKDVKLNSWIIWDKGTKAQNSTRSYINVAEHILFFVKGIAKDLNIPTELNSVRDYLRQEKKKTGLTNKDFSLMFSKFYAKNGCLDRSVIEHYFSEMQWVFPSREIYENILQKTNFFQKNYDELKKEYTSTRFTFNIDDIRTKRNPKDKRFFVNEKQLVPNVWYFNCKDEMAKIDHPTPKPLEMIEIMIKASSNKSDTILDPFMGSGTTGVACKNLNRNFIGIEIDPTYFKIAQDRINNTPDKLL